MRWAARVAARAKQLTAPSMVTAHRASSRPFIVDPGSDQGCPSGPDCNNNANHDTAIPSWQAPARTRPPILLRAVTRSLSANAPTDSLRQLAGSPPAGRVTTAGRVTARWLGHRTLANGRSGSPPVARRAVLSQYLRMNAGSLGSPREQPVPSQVDLAVEVFRMLADATRVRLLWALLDAELAVNELAHAVGKAPAGVSQHLAKLRMARLVRTRRQGTQVFYRIENSHLRQLVEDAIYHVEHVGTGVPDHHRSDLAVTALTPAAGSARTGTP